ncbi:hypothetical protein KSS87_023052 [Heliosperma pusillum]|nr:hypothetical protein KSS87_023052 [Heliosperma pusillum]
MAAVEETIPVTIEQEVVSAPTTEVSPTAEKTAGNVAGNDGKVVTKTKGRKPKKVRSSPSHPTYVEMITEALTTLKEKNGSSQHAIQKFIEENHKNLPSNFRKLLLGSLRKLVASGKLVKVKNSFKLPSTRSASKPSVVKAKPAAIKPKKAAVKPKKAVTAAAKPKKAVTAAVKPKSGRTRTVVAAAAVTAKAKANAKAVKPAVKAKVAAVVVKPKVAGTKRKAAAVVVKPKEKAAKVAKTATKATPSKKVVPVAKVAKSAAAKSVKSVKPKSVKSPAKRAMPRRGKK